jgi:hypothetical protein
MQHRAKHAPLLLRRRHAWPWRASPHVKQSIMNHASGQRAKIQMHHTCMHPNSWKRAREHIRKHSHLCVFLVGLWWMQTNKRPSVARFCVLQQVEFASVVQSIREHISLVQIQPSTRKNSLSGGRLTCEKCAIQVWQIPLDDLGKFHGVWKRQFCAKLFCFKACNCLRC